MIGVINFFSARAGLTGPLCLQETMLAARLSRALPRAAQAVRGRAMSGPTLSGQLGTVKDVPIKDIPQWASSVQKDPKTEQAVQVPSAQSPETYGMYSALLFSR